MICNTLHPRCELIRRSLFSGQKLSDIAGAENCHFCQGRPIRASTTAIFVDPNGALVFSGTIKTAAVREGRRLHEPSPGRTIRHFLCADSQARTLFLASLKMRS
jgi:hypothetical protein